jgi:methylenetetrahydromethanopterin dehydrogenase
MVVKVGIAKLGNIASGVMAELLLDKRADREDVQTFMATSGTKLQPEDIDRVVSNMKPDAGLCDRRFPERFFHPRRA